MRGKVIDWEEINRKARKADALLTADALDEMTVKTIEMRFESLAMGILAWRMADRVGLKIEMNGAFIAVLQALDRLAEMLAVVKEKMGGGSMKREPVITWEEILTRARADLWREIEENMRLGAMADIPARELGTEALEAKYRALGRMLRDTVGGEEDDEE